MALQMKRLVHVNQTSFMMIRQRTAFNKSLSEKNAWFLSSALEVGCPAVMDVVRVKVEPYLLEKTVCPRKSILNDAHKALNVITMNTCPAGMECVSA